MIGILGWKERRKKEGAVTVGECSVLHMRFLRAEVLREESTPELLLRRRALHALRKLRGQGVTRVILPEDFLWKELLERAGVRPVSTLPLRRLLAADWAAAELGERGIPAGSARVAVAADRLTGEAVRTVTELVLRYRHVLLDIPRGGEELSRQLRREYGAALQLISAREQLEEADAAVLFDPREMAGGRVCLRLYEESQPMPSLLLPPLLEGQLPVGAARLAILSVLWEAGMLKPGQITLAGKLP